MTKAAEIMEDAPGVRRTGSINSGTDILLKKTRKRALKRSKKLYLKARTLRGLTVTDERSRHLLNFQLAYMSYLDNIFRQHGDILYKKNPRSVKCWQRVLKALNTYQIKTNDKGLYSDELIIGNPEVTIDSTAKIDAFIKGHIYELTSISRDISGNWRTVKDALEKYAFDLVDKSKWSYTGPMVNVTNL